MTETEEVWTYTGIRVLNSKRVHSWRDPGGVTRLYHDTGSFVIGGRYEVTTERIDDKVSRGQPQYTGEYIADDSERRTLAIQDEAARAQLARLAVERSDSKRDELAAILEPVKRQAATLRTIPERDAFLAAILRAVYGQWWTG